MVVGYLEPSFVILSAGVGREANGAESKDPGTANPEKDIREFSQFNISASSQGVLRLRRLSASRTFRFARDDVI